MSLPGVLQGEVLKISRLTVFRDILPKVSGSWRHCITPRCDVDPACGCVCQRYSLIHHLFIWQKLIQSLPSAKDVMQSKLPEEVMVHW